MVMMKGMKKAFIAALTIAGLLTAIVAMQATLVSAASVRVSLGSPQQNSHFMVLFPYLSQPPMLVVERLPSTVSTTTWTEILAGE